MDTEREQRDEEPTDLWAYLEHQMLNPGEDVRLMVEWLKRGMAMGWITTPFCGTHGQAPVSPREAMAFVTGDEPCIMCVRLIPLAEEGHGH